MRRRHLDKARDAYELYRSNDDPEWKEAKGLREKYGDRIEIKLLCCFGTVGALGVPENVLYRRMSLVCRCRGHGGNDMSFIIQER